MSDDEIDAIASRLGLDAGAFRERFTRELRGGDVTLVEKPNRDCVFFARDAGCTIYEDRPLQCRTWPFWRAVVHSPETWLGEALNCPGMEAGRLYSEAEIEASLANDGTSGRRR